MALMYRRLDTPNYERENEARTEAGRVSQRSSRRVRVGHDCAKEEESSAGNRRVGVLDRLEYAQSDEVKGSAKGSNREETTAAREKRW